MSRSPAPAPPHAGQTAAGTALAYLALALVWGSSFLLIKVSLTLFSPLQVAVGRIWLGAAALSVAMMVTGTRWPRGVRLWVDMLVVGALLCVVPFALFSWAGQFLPSGLSAVLNATTPIWTAIAVTTAVRGQRLTARQLAGIALGLVGVCVVTGLWRIWDGSVLSEGLLLAQAACLAATACYGAGFAYLQIRTPSLRGHRPLAIAAAQVTAATALSLLVAPVVASSPVHLYDRGQDSLMAGALAVVSLIVLGSVGTGLAYVWNARVIAHWGSLAASSVTYLTPVVGLVVGAIGLGETVRWNAPVGAAVVVVSVLLVHGRRLAVPSRWRLARDRWTRTPSTAMHSGDGDQ